MPGQGLQPHATLTPEHDASGAHAALHAAVLGALLAYNERFIPPADPAPLGIAARDGAGALLGGIVGHTTWAATGEGWLYVELLWVAETQRGCRHAYLNTFDFQARPFYERHGYAVFGVQEDFPPGSRRYWLRRTLGEG